ncbi:hypothetical protein [Cellulomonas soli]
MLAPFTIVGPFAGVLLDRWQRRQVLAWGNAVRALLTATMAVLMLTGGVSGWIAVLGLATLSVNRFLLAGLSAGLPRVVDGPLLLTANSLTPTLGAGATFLGGGIGVVLGRMLEPGRLKDSAALLCAAVVFAMAALLALRMARTLLGPERPNEGAITHELAVVARGLGRGARYLVARRTPGQALLVMAVHRFLYGVVFLAAILISRNLLSDPGDADAGMATFALVLGLTGVGGAGAVVLTPTLSRYTGAQAWIALMLLLAAAGQVLLLTSPHVPWSSPAPPCSGWRRRARRSPSTRSCSATRTTRSVVGRSPSTTCSTTRRSSARQRWRPSRCPTRAGRGRCSPRWAWRTC